MPPFVHASTEGGDGPFAGKGAGKWPDQGSLTVVERCDRDVAIPDRALRRIEKVQAIVAPAPG